MSISPFWERSEVLDEARDGVPRYAGQSVAWHRGLVAAGDDEVICHLHTTGQPDTRTILTVCFLFLTNIVLYFSVLYLLHMSNSQCVVLEVVAGQGRPPLGQNCLRGEAEGVSVIKPLSAEEHDVTAVPWHSPAHVALSVAVHDDESGLHVVLPHPQAAVQSVPAPTEEVVAVSVAISPPALGHEPSGHAGLTCARMEHFHGVLQRDQQPWQGV